MFGCIAQLSGSGEGKFHLEHFGERRDSRISHSETRRKS
jgi:hypothetical protein